MVEHSAVNRRVVGSSPTRGAKFTPNLFFGFFVCMKYYLYILQSLSADKFYIGVSENPDRRLVYHNSIEKGFTSRYRPWKLVFTQAFDSKSDALKAERKLKSWKSKVMIRKVISGEIRF